MPYPERPPIVVPDPWPVDDEHTLRLPHDGDVAALTAACSDPEVRRFTLVPAPYVETDARDWIHGSRKLAAAGEGVHLVVADGVSDALRAAVGITIDWRDGGAELGFWATPLARGHGLVRRAAREVCRFALEDVGVARLWLQTAATNTDSHRLAAALGFRHEGTARAAGLDGDAGDLTAPRVDMLLFGLLPGELHCPD